MPPTQEDFIIISDDESDSDQTLPFEHSEDSREIVPRRNGPVDLPFLHLEDSQEYGWRIKIGDSVEIDTPNGSFVHGDFMRIIHIIKNLNTDEMFLRGCKLRRNGRFSGTLPLRLNEVCLTLDVDADDPRPPFEQGLEEIPIDVIHRKRKINITNACFPTHSYREHTNFASRGRNAIAVERSIRSSSELVCRWIFIRTFETARHRIQNRQKVCEATLRRVSERETDPEYADSDKQLYLHYRKKRPSNLSYDYGDAFSGCGGMAHGAKQAGLNVKWAFDKDHKACLTFNRNFEGTDIVNACAHDFLACKDDVVVDILHLSPPCQTFSPAHTVPGKNDEANEATFFAVAELVRKVRPRVVTLEETFGLVQRHEEWFNALVNMLTSEGYSVRWKQINMAEYGLAQPRRRIVVVASCPGGVLPNLPKPTHGERRGLLPFTTIANALASVHPGSTLQIEFPKPKSPLQRTPYSINTQLRGCICTRGVSGNRQNYHPSGTRNFTLRELACLQSFPESFLFHPTQKVGDTGRQIGNAVPPAVAKTIFTEVRNALANEDRQRWGLIT